MSEANSTQLSQTSESHESSEESVSITNETNSFNKLVPLKADLMEHYTALPTRIKGESYALCNYCTEESKKGGDNKIVKIKAKPNNLRKHLKHCKYFYAHHNITIDPKPVAVTKPRQTKTQRALKRKTSVGCVTINVKFSRKMETMEVTPGLKGEQLVNDLKDIFNIDNTTQCFLRREVDRKILLGCNDVVTLLGDGETLKLECAK
ncbi:Uncharacterized protein QTN25_006303 [Entamoeba marina]